MRTILVIALAIPTLTLVPPITAQSSKPAGDSSSKISTVAPADTPDDEAFAAYQRVTKDIKPPKAKSSPDPAYPELPPYTEPNGIVDMLVGIDTVYQSAVQ